MRYPKPQKGNPHRLTMNQHIFPKSCIARFANANGTVQVRHKGETEDKRLNPENSYFCARRLWDQRTEAVVMKAIEDRYQNVAAGIISGSITTFNAKINEYVTQMYLLWTLRHERYTNPLPDANLPGANDQGGMLINTQEILESNGYMFAEPNNIIPSRFTTGFLLTMQLSMELRRMAEARWGIFRSIGAEFLVPDNFSACCILPVTPNIALVAGHADQTVGFNQVAEINGQAVLNSLKYYFSRDLSYCPILK